MFTPPGLPAYQAQQDALTASSGSSGGGFGFGDFFGGVLDTAAAYGTSLLQLDLFRDQARTQAEINNLQGNTATGGGTPSTVQGSANGGGGVVDFFTQPSVLIGGLVLILLFVLLSRKSK